MQWLELLPHKQESSGSDSDAGHSAWSLHVISVPAWVLFGFLTRSKGMHVRLETLGLGCTLLNKARSLLFSSWGPNKLNGS